MPIINFGLRSSGAVAGYNITSDLLSGGVKFAAGSVVDIANTVVPGVTFAVTDGWQLITSNGEVDDGSGYPIQIQNGTAASQSADPAQMVIGGLTDGHAVDVTLYSNHTFGDLVGDFVVTGAPGSTFSGTTDGGAADVAAKTLTGNVTIGPAGTLTIDVSAAGSNQAVLNLIRLDINSGVPVITLIGNDPESIVSGSASSYADAGATALDDNDGDITGDIVVTGLPTDFIGSHTVRYNVDDAASNSADEVTRTINVTVPAGYQYIDLVDPDLADTAKLLAGLTGDPAVTSDQLVATNTTPIANRVGFTLVPDGGIVFDSVPTVTQTIPRYVIKADGTVGAETVFTYTVAASNNAATGVPVLLGVAQEGQTLTPGPGTLADADGLGVLSYQLQRDGVDIPGATGSYVLTQADVGAVIRVGASFQDGQGNQEGPIYSAATVTVAAISSPPPDPTPEIPLGMGFASTRLHGNYRFINGKWSRTEN